jgi:hypothetical protein
MCCLQRAKKRKSKKKSEKSAEMEYLDEDGDEVVNGGDSKAPEGGVEEEGGNDADLGGGVDLDAIMGDTFLEDEGVNDEEEALKLAATAEMEEGEATADGPLPSRATQNRPEDEEGKEKR